jgi:hypothetical protein
VIEIDDDRWHSIDYGSKNCCRFGVREDFKPSRKESALVIRKS